MRKQKMMPAREHPAYERPEHPFIQRTKAPKGKRKVPAVERVQLYIVAQTPNTRRLLLVHKDSTLTRVLWTGKLELAKCYTDADAVTKELLALREVCAAYKEATLINAEQWELAHT